MVVVLAVRLLEIQAEAVQRPITAKPVTGAIARAAAAHSSAVQAGTERMGKAPDFKALRGAAQAESTARPVVGVVIAAMRPLVVVLAAASLRHQRHSAEVAAVSIGP